MLAGGAVAQQLSWPQGETFTSRDYQDILHQVTKPGAEEQVGPSPATHSISTPDCSRLV